MFAAELRDLASSSSLFAESTGAPAAATSTEAIPQQGTRMETPPRSGGTGGMPATLASLSGTDGVMHKQGEWERAMDSADQKQNELYHFQWSLVRDQIGHLARTVAECRRDLDMTRHIIQNEVAPRLADNRDIISEERKAREASEAAIVGRLELSEKQASQVLAARAEELMDQLSKERTARSEEVASLKVAIEAAATETRLRDVVSHLEGTDVALSAQLQELRSETFQNLDSKTKDLQRSHDVLRGQHESQVSDVVKKIGDQFVATAALESRLLTQEASLAQDRSKREEIRDELTKDISATQRKSTEGLSQLTSECREVRDMLERGRELDRSERSRIMSSLQERIGNLEQRESVHAHAASASQVELEHQINNLRTGLETHTHTVPTAVSTVTAVPMTSAATTIVARPSLRDPSPGPLGAAARLQPAPARTLVRSHSHSALENRKVSTVSPGPSARRQSQRSDNIKTIAPVTGASVVRSMTPPPQPQDAAIGTRLTAPVLSLSGSLRAAPAETSYSAMPATSPVAFGSTFAGSTPLGSMPLAAGTGSLTGFTAPVSAPSLGASTGSVALAAERLRERLAVSGSAPIRDLGNVLRAYSSHS